VNGHGDRIVESIDSAATLPSLAVLPFLNKILVLLLVKIAMAGKQLRSSHAVMLIGRGIERSEIEMESSEDYQAMKKILLFWQLSTVTKSKTA
jgi:hypothetical protein